MAKRKRYPPKKPMQWQVKAALDIYNTKDVKTQEEIEAIPSDKTPKQRAKPKRIELPMQRHLVQEIAKHYPGVDVVSLRDEKTHMVENERQLQAGVKRPDLLILARRHGAGALYLEIKTEPADYLTRNGKIRASQHIQEQYKGLQRRRRSGYLAFFAGGFDEAWSIVTWYFDGQGTHPLEHLYSDVLGEGLVVDVPQVEQKINGHIIVSDDWETFING